MTGAPAWGAGRWHYRRSLASRVILLTTIAVGLAVAFVALGAFLTVRTSLQSTLDNSLLERANKAASNPDLLNVTANYHLPSWALGAGDIRIIFINSRGDHQTFDQGPALTLGRPELAVADGQTANNIRTISTDNIDYRVVTVPAGDGQALVIAQSMAPQERC